MTDKTTLIIYLPTYNIDDYNKFDKKTLVFQKLLNSTENVVVISNISLKEIVENNRVFGNLTFIDITKLEECLNLKTKFNFEIFLKVNSMLDSEYTIFFDEQSLNFHLEFFSKNQIFRMILHYSNNILLYNQNSAKHFSEFEHEITKKLKLLDEERYRKINTDFFSGKKGVIEQLEIIFNSYLEENNIDNMDESLIISYLAIQNPNFFFFLHNGPKYDYVRFFVYFIQSYKERHDEDLAEFFLNLSYESHYYKSNQQYF